MDPPNAESQRSLQRSNSMSQASEISQTAQEFINSQLQLEADAREALPYQFDTCTRPMGALRQILFSCLTCNPPPSDPNGPYTPAGVCYSCSISCHGEHTLVELFNKRNFVCDCGTSRLPDSAPCTLRINEMTGQKGDVTSEEPAKENKYNPNFKNRFCGCGEEYDAHQEKGTMFQCLGLGTFEEGGCGEDWWHPECVVGYPRRWYETEKKPHKNSDSPSAGLSKIVEEPGQQSGDHPNGTAPEATRDTAMNDAGDDDPPFPPGFPKEEDFEHFICYKCVDAFPWIKQYADTPGFLPPVQYRPQSESPTTEGTTNAPKVGSSSVASETPSGSLKRKAEDEASDPSSRQQPGLKRQRSADDQPATSNDAPSTPYHATLPPAPTSKVSLFLKEDFRTHFCRCPACFPQLSQHPQLLEEEDTYEPPLSEDSGGHNANGNRSTGSRSLLDRGEAALSNIDRVRAIEGVMVYNHLKDKVKDFLKPFAESGRAVGAEDIKAYFEKLRGDAEAIKAARGGAAADGEDGDGEGDSRKEQSGY